MTTLLVFKLLCCIFSVSAACSLTTLLQIPDVALLTCVMFSACLLFFQAMKGEKGIPGVAVGESLGEDLTEDSFSKC